MLEIDTPCGADISPGYRFSRSHTFNPEQVRAFSLAAGDENPIHLDAELAGRSQFGGLIVSGTHTSSILMGLTATHFSRLGKVLGMNFSLDLLHPVMADETVALGWIVTSTAAHLKGGYVIDLEGTIKGGKGLTYLHATGRVLFTPSSD